MIRILHAADFHLDSPFEGLSQEQAILRRAEQRALLERMAELCAADGVQLVLLAGDLFDSDGAYQETTDTLVRILSGIEAPVFIAPGNHDFYGRNSRFARTALPENVHVFKASQLECVELPELSARVWGAGFTDSYSGGLLRSFRAEKREGIVDIMCIHGEVGNPASQYNPVSENEIAESGMDYIALGHVHSFSGLKRAGNSFYAWPGCAEGRGFDELGEKGVIIADVDCGRTELRFVPLGGRKYDIRRINVTDDDIDDIAAAVLRSLPKGAHHDIYRLILTGECRTSPNLSALRRRLEGRIFGLQLRDETRLRRDIWERSGEDSLRGAFLRRLEAKYEAAQSEEERKLITQAVGWGLAALDGGEEVETV